MKQRKWLNRFLIIVITIFLILVSYLAVIYSSFSDPTKANAFLRKAKTYQYLSEIIKIETKNKINQEGQNPLQTFIAAGLTNQLVTPQVVESFGIPTMKLVYGILKDPAPITGSTTIDTSEYKKQLMGQVSRLNLPELITTTVNNAINSIPEKVTFTSQTKDQNNLPKLLNIVKAVFNKLSTALNILIIALVISLAGLIAVNFHIPKRFFKSTAWSFGIAGTIVFTSSYFLPYIIHRFTPRSSDPLIGSQINGLINSVVNRLFEQLRILSTIFIITALIAYLVYRFAFPSRNPDDPIAKLS
ncbi:MAG: hypothetical protein Q8P54_02005 [bacterium]|nr:hypothetical protein [bacterium]